MSQRALRIITGRTSFVDGEPSVTDLLDLCLLLSAHARLQRGDVNRRLARG